MGDHARVASNLVQLRDGRSFHDLGLHELPWPNGEIGGVIEIDEVAWHVVDIVSGKMGSSAIAIEPLVRLGI
jgi:hypothetical protein